MYCSSHEFLANAGLARDQDGEPLQAELLDQLAENEIGAEDSSRARSECRASRTRRGGPALSALCFGLVATLAVGLVSACLVLGDGQRPVKPPLPAVTLFILLAPGVALQSVGTSFEVFAGWLAGTAAGAYLGVVGGARLRARFGLVGK